MTSLSTVETDVQQQHSHKLRSTMSLQRTRLSDDCHRQYLGACHLDPWLALHVHTVHSQHAAHSRRSSHIHRRSPCTLHDTHSLQPTESHNLTQLTFLTQYV